jgi:hypothetical protein
MKLLFATLLCHRDVPVFKFNWFSIRAHLNHGFDIPHLVLNDGTLTEDDLKNLQKYPGIIIDPNPIILYLIPNPILTAKLQCFERGFTTYEADRVVIFDPDVFIYKPWDSILNHILMSPGAICLKDWGSSLGPHQDRYKALFGVMEDATTPNCNTGVYSIPKALYGRVPPVLEKHIKEPFQIMEDQGIFFAAFYGMMDYITDIKCLINGVEEHPYMWDWILKNPIGAHLQGMRVRPKALASLINHTINCCPKKILLSQITPFAKHISYGMLNFGSYDYTRPFQECPTQWEGKYVLDGMYMHAGSWAEWHLPPQITHFESKYVCMHTGNPSLCRPFRINGNVFNLGANIYLEIKGGTLKIETEYSEGGHLCFLCPTLKVNLEPAALIF